MSTSQTNVIEIIKADAELRADERIGGRIELSSDAVWLEAIDTSSHVINVVSPTCHYGVSLDGLARNSSRSH
jgi:hypothetical protein